MFQTFFLGKENVNNPLAREIISIGKEIGKIFSNSIVGNISVRYGKRILITTYDEIASLTEDNLAEVVDYDVVRNIAFVIGKEEPSNETAMHWLIYRREDINAIIHIHKLLSGLPTTEEEKPPGSLEIAMEALKLLKNNNCINLKNHGCIAIGENLRKAMEAIPCL